MSNWDKEELWHRYGNKFLIEVRHSYGEPDGFNGSHRWYLYAYIYRGHPLFTKFDGTHIYQDATKDMPLHGGCSYLRYHVNSDKALAGTPIMLSSIQVGCDYNHLHDEYYTNMDTTRVDVILDDAQRLHNYLTEIVNEQLAPGPEAEA